MLPSHAHRPVDELSDEADKTIDRLRADRDNLRTKLEDAAGALLKVVGERDRLREALTGMLAGLAEATMVLHRISGGNEDHQAACCCGDCLDLVLDALAVLSDTKGGA